MTLDKKVRVRYAPSPTGFLHIGNARTALFNYLFAKSKGGDFIVRIEDTDTKRNVEGGIESQLENLKWLGIEWDESVDKGGPYAPYKQTERLHIYSRYAKKLLEKNLAYKCYCSEEELERDRKQQKESGALMPKYSGRCKHLTELEKTKFEKEGRVPSVRFAVPEDMEITFEDLVKGPVKFQSNDFGDFVIMKRDGIPTYQFAVVVDDHTMDITHVLRGDDHLTNTPKQLMIYEALGFPIPEFAHMSLIVDFDGKKLSKRDDRGETTFIEDFKNKGFLSESLFNFISLLGWSPGGEKELFERDELITLFDEKRLLKSSATFDKKKLLDMNKDYLKKWSDEKYLEMALPFLNELSIEAAKELVLLYRKELQYVAQIKEKLPLFLTEEIAYDDQMKQVIETENAKKVILSFYDKAKNIDFTKDRLTEIMEEVKKETGLKGKDLILPIRIVSTGEMSTPDIAGVLSILGKEKVLKRIKDFLHNQEDSV